ncbi:MAG TPA: hypothetical protein VGP93_01400, partial [Polyangiaceae bacterium]|nr:hypothetical protein [Polyangiaceae bacterium]
MERSLLGLVLLLAACSPDKSSGGDSGKVTFYEDVAPIVYENCVGCHRPGSITPFSLIDYASARTVAANMALATADRVMPPMPVDNSGSCNTYSNARWLSDEEIAIIGKWADDGALEGNPAAAPPVPEAPPGMAAVDATLDMGVTYSPNADLSDDYRCFVLPAPVANSTFVTAYEVVPGDTRVVHHVIVYQPHDDAEALKAHDRDAAEAGDGYTCFGGPGVDADPLVLWAPGAGVVDLPQGTGIQLEGGRDLVMQIHYNLAGGSFPDRTLAHLGFAKVGVTPAGYMPIPDLEMKLAPGMATVETTATIQLGTHQPFTLWGALPHMHTLGRTLHVDLQAGGNSTCLVNVDRWDFHWQNAWWYETPLHFASADSVSIRCGYDTTDRSDTVTWGESTTDEMCLNYVYVSSP